MVQKLVSESEKSLNAPSPTPLSDSLTNKQQGHSEVQHVPGQNVSGAASRSTFLLVCERRAANRLRFYWSENGITDQNLRDQHA